MGNNLDYLSNIRLNNLIAMQEIKDNLNAAARIIRESAIQTDAAHLTQEKHDLEQLIVRNNDLLRQLDEKLKLKNHANCWRKLIRLARLIPMRCEK